jgi:hypothetical protein
MAKRYNTQKKRKNRPARPSTAPQTAKAGETSTKPVTQMNVPVYSMTRPAPTRVLPSAVVVEATRYESLSKELRKVFIITAIILVILVILWAVLR